MFLQSCEIQGRRQMQCHGASSFWLLRSDMAAACSRSLLWIKYLSRRHSLSHTAAHLRTGQLQWVRGCWNVLKHVQSMHSFKIICVDSYALLRLMLPWHIVWIIAGNLTSWQWFSMIFIDFQWFWPIAVNSKLPSRPHGPPTDSLDSWNYGPGPGPSDSWHVLLKQVWQHAMHHMPSAYAHWNIQRERERVIDISIYLSIYRRYTLNLRVYEHVDV